MLLDVRQEKNGGMSLLTMAGQWGLLWVLEITQEVSRGLQLYYFSVKVLRAQINVVVPADWDWLGLGHHTLSMAQVPMPAPALAVRLCPAVMVYSLPSKDFWSLYQGLIQTVTVLLVTPISLLSQIHSMILAGADSSWSTVLNWVLEELMDRCLAQKLRVDWACTPSSYPINSQESKSPVSSTVQQVAAWQHLPLSRGTS